ncbi:transposase family protein [Clostridium sp. UBA4548]|uniref:transposase family protein n=1 Tax=Clostridium sp. UBA4548 TaxID=1946361 RepID=UPI0025BCEA85|nr:transposase family protein [Clostridium sp. UBA4548]
MDEIIKLLDSNLEYMNHEIINNTLYIEVASTRGTVVCPYCGAQTQKVHSYYKKSFQDLPIQEHKVIITINNRKMFCNNPECSKKTFAESFDFLAPNAKKSKRLDNEILNISMNVSSLAAEQIIKNRIANVGKSTICNLLKNRK